MHPPLKIPYFDLFRNLWVFAPTPPWNTFSDCSIQFFPAPAFRIHHLLSNHRVSKFKQIIYSLVPRLNWLTSLLISHFFIGINKKIHFIILTFFFPSAQKRTSTHHFLIHLLDYITGSGRSFVPLATPPFFFFAFLALRVTYNIKWVCRIDQHKHTIWKKKSSGNQISSDKTRI